MEAIVFGEMLNPFFIHFKHTRFYQSPLGWLVGGKIDFFVWDNYKLHDGIQPSKVF